MTIKFGADFSINGVAEEGLSPTIKIRRTDTQAVVINGAAVPEVGDGGYNYDFENDTALQYHAIIDGGIDTLDSRYMVAWSERAKAEAEVVDIKTQTDKMNFTGDDIKSTLDSEEVVTDSASRTASKATGFSVPNEYDAALSVIAVDVAGLNGEAMRGTDNAPTAADIVTGILNGVIEGTLTLKEAQRVLLAPIAGESDGARTATQHFRNTLDTKNVVTATVDEDGNRTGITLDVSD